MRRLSYGLVALLLLVACAKEAQEPQWEGPVIELSLSCLDPTAPTKAGSDGVQAGENSYHENLISWVDFYFYPGNATSSDATYHIRKTSGKRDNDVFRLELTTNQVNYRIFPVLNNITQATVFAIANASQEMLDALDNTSLDYLQSLVVSTEFVNVSYTNHRQDHFLMSGTTTITLAGRSQKVVSQGLVNLERYASKITVGIKMDDEVEIDTGRKDAQEQKIYEKWRPRPTEMQIYLVDGVGNVTLGGVPAGREGGVTTPEFISYRDNPMRFYDGAGNQYFDKSGDYYNTFPMYTYPYHWGEGSEREPYLKLVLPWDRVADPDHNISSMQKEFYYKILIPMDRRGGEYANSFIRNNWYHYDVEVGVLGADTDEAATPVEASLFIVYWQDKDVVVKHANIGNARYLSLAQTEYTLHNVNTVDAGYITSHPLNHNIASVTRPYYGTKTSGTDLGADIVRADGTHVLCGTGSTVVMDTDLYTEGSYFLSYSQAQREAIGGGTDWFTDTGSAIRMTHAINNDYSTSHFDYSPYTIFLELWHADGIYSAEFVRTVKITQYPGVYIVAEMNSDPRVSTEGGNDDVENTTKAWMNYEHNGYVFIDGARRTRNVLPDGTGGLYDALVKEMQKLGYTGGDSGTAHPYLQWLQWRTVNFTGGNKNMYNIVVTVLPENSDFVIGDPRTKEPDNLNNGAGETGYGGEANGGFDFTTSFAPGIPIGGGAERPLTYYYPAENSTRTENMIAPGLRVASKFGGMEYGKADQRAATYKCATYQEDGYPAGRWRLPTLAEIKFITTLQAQKTFVTLFGTTTYWCVHGAVTVNSNGTVSVNKNETMALARCVYDSWYWDQLPDEYNRLPANDRDRYVLGDLPRQ